MSTDKRAILKQWLSSGKAALQPLTFPQREIWETSPVPPGDTANYICARIDVHGVMTLPACQTALQRVVDRQEALRLSFLPGKERPVQMIRTSAEANLHFRDLAPAQCTDEAIDDLAREVYLQPFDMLQGPLFHAQLWRRGAEDQVMILAIHHAIADGWTLGVFVEDLCLAYILGLRGEKNPLPPVPLTYSAWGAMEREYWQPAELEKRAAFWKPLLAGIPRLWDSTAGAETPLEPLERWVTLHPAALAEAAQDLARVAGATLYSTLLTAFQASLSQWTGQPDTVVGTPVANRSIKNVRETMGYCAGIVPLRGQIDPQMPFADCLRSIHQATVECFSNAMPFAELAAALGHRPRPGHCPVYEVRFALQNHPIPDVSLHGLSAKLSMRSTGTARFHLGCEVTLLSSGLEIVWLFRPSLLPKVEIENLARIFTSMIASACRSPESRIANLLN